MQIRLPSRVVARGLVLAASAVSFIGCVPESVTRDSSARAYDIVGNGAKAVRTTRELEPIGRQVSAVLGDQTARTFMANAMRQSRMKERKLELKVFLEQMDREISARLPEALRAELSDAIEGVQEYQPLEIYFPIRDQRNSWKADKPVQVLVVHGDDDEPVAFNRFGSRSVLSSRTAPAEFTLTITQAEQTFAPRGFASAEEEPPCDPENEYCEPPCDPQLDPECEEGGGGDPPGGGEDPPGGGDPPLDDLYLTRINIYEDHEGWPRGEPEFEIHVLGVDATGDSLHSISCVGEEQSGLQHLDYDDVGNGFTPSLPILLFTGGSMLHYDSVTAGRELRLLVIEDDNGGPCNLKLDEDDWDELISDVDGAYGNAAAFHSYLTGSTPTDIEIDDGPSIPFPFGLLYDLIRLIFTTNTDDIVGLAVVDATFESWTSNSGIYNRFIQGIDNVNVGKIQVKVQ